MKFFEGMQKFFESIGEYVKNFSNLFFIFIGAFVLISFVIIVMTSFAYECKMTKTVDKINKFLERNPRINDDNLVAFNNMMKAKSVPKTLRRQWQQFMLYREHPASYYMSFKHCVENPLRNSTYNQQMTVYRIISYVLVVLSLVVSAFMATPASFTSVLQEILVIPITILVFYWLISMVLNLIHSAISGDLFQNYQYFEINMDKAMLTLPDFVDYEVLFSQDEIRRGIPVLFAYLQKRAIQEQQELEKARLKSVDHEKFDFDKAGLDGSLVLDRAMRETENYAAQRKKYMQEIERVNNEISVLENNYREQTKEFQRQVQTSKETVENLKEQLEQATSTIEINYIKKQMRDELNRQQMAEKEFDILTDKHNQEIKSLNQEIKHYEDEIQKAKEALEVAMLSEFNTYSVKVYDILEKIVDEKMQDKVDEYKTQIKDLEVFLEEKNEELENVYTRYQEVISQIPQQYDEPEQVEPVEDLSGKKAKKKKKGAEVVEQPVYDNYADQADYQQYNYGNDQYIDNQYTAYTDNQQYGDYIPTEEYSYDEQYADYQPEAEQTLPQDEYVDDYVPLTDNFDSDIPVADEYVPLTGDFTDTSTDEEYIPADEYIPANDFAQDDFYVPLSEQPDYSSVNDEYIPSTEQFEVPVAEPVEESIEQPKEEIEDIFDDSDFDIDFNKPTQRTTDFDDLDFEFDLGDEEPEDEGEDEPKPPVVDEEIADLDLNKILGLYDDVEPKAKVEPAKQEDIKIEPVEEKVEDPIEDVQPEAPKRKVGRPRKVVTEEDIKPKRKVGRPRKVVEEVKEEQPKRKAGRPRKTEVKQVVNEPKRKAGRPKKVVDEKLEVLDKPKRKAGRPRKEDSKVGTTTKTASAKKSTAKIDSQPAKRRGRPKKQTIEVVKPEAKKRGRPRKN